GCNPSTYQEIMYAAADVVKRTSTDAPSVRAEAEVEVTKRYAGAVVIVTKLQLRCRRRLGSRCGAQRYPAADAHATGHYQCAARRAAGGNRRRQRHNAVGMVEEHKG